MDTLKLTKPIIGFVDIDKVITDKAIKLEAKLIFRQIGSLKKLIICTPNKTEEFKR